MLQPARRVAQERCSSSLGAASDDVSDPWKCSAKDRGQPQQKVVPMGKWRSIFLIRRLRRDTITYGARLVDKQWHEMPYLD